MDENQIKMYMEIGHNMMELCKQFKVCMKRELDKTELSFVEAITLLSIQSSVEQSAEKIAESIGYDKSVMTRTLQKMEIKGLVVRRPHPKDGRAWLFSLTEAGCKETETAIAAMMKWSQIVYGEMSEKEVHRLMELMQNLVRKMNATDFGKEK